MKMERTGRGPPQGAQARTHTDVRSHYVLDTGSFSRALNTPASFPGCQGFKFHPRNWLSDTFIVVYISPSTLHAAPHNLTEEDGKRQTNCGGSMKRQVDGQEKFTYRFKEWERYYQSILCSFNSSSFSVVPRTIRWLVTELWSMLKNVVVACFNKIFQNFRDIQRSVLQYEDGDLWKWENQSEKYIYYTVCETAQDRGAWICSLNTWITQTQP